MRCSWQIQTVISLLLAHAPRLLPDRHLPAICREACQAGPVPRHGKICKYRAVQGRLSPGRASACGLAYQLAGVAAFSLKFRLRPFFQLVIFSNLTAFTLISLHPFPRLSQPLIHLLFRRTSTVLTPSVLIPFLSSPSLNKPFKLAPVMSYGGGYGSSRDGGYSNGYV